MRLQLILPRVEPGEIEIPAVCPYKGCEGRHFRHHQEVDKPLKDTRYDSVQLIVTSVCAATGLSVRTQKV